MALQGEPSSILVGQVGDAVGAGACRFELRVDGEPVDEVFGTGHECPLEVDLGGDEPRPVGRPPQAADGRSPDTSIA